MSAYVVLRLFRFSLLWILTSALLLPGCQGPSQPTAAGENRASLGTHPTPAAVPTADDSHQKPAAEPEPTTSKPPPHDVDFVLKQGPWGRVEGYAVRLSPPPFVTDDLLNQASVSPSEWYVEGADEQTLRGLIAKHLDNPEWSAEALATLKRDAEPNRWTFQLPDAARQRLSSGSRAALYALLRTDRRNMYLSAAHTFVGESVQDWLAPWPLSIRTKEAVERLAYKRGSVHFLADVDLLMQEVEDADEQRLLIKALASQGTYVLRLRIDSPEEVPKLVKYWGGDGREDVVAPLLDSVAAPGVSRTIDVVHLLPPFARQRLFRYPDPSRPATVTLIEDCYWTSVSFSGQQAEGRGAVESPLRQLEEEFVRLDNPRLNNLQLGDVIVFFNGDRPTHAAVVIAGDIVFTKNGPSLKHPWMFMRLKHVQDLYAYVADPKITVFRHR